MKLVKIESMSAYHPSTVVSTKELLEEAGVSKLGICPNSVAELLKINHVHHENVDVKPSEMAARASASALEKAGISADELDLVIYCGIHKDCDEPATACNTADRLGAHGGRLQLAIDLTSACHGLAAAIDLARHGILAGQYQHVLICSAEKPSEWFYRLRDELRQGKYSKEEAENLLGFFSCGDVGAATVLTRSSEGRGIVYCQSACQPQYAMSCYVGMDEKFGHMDMRAISRQTIDLVSSMNPKAIAKKAGWQEPDHLIQHQVGMKPYLIGTKVFGVNKSKSPAIFPQFGNLTTASLVATLEMTEVKPWDKVIISSTGSGISATQLGFVA